MHPDCLVSIIIDNYNYAAFLSQAIESALAQSHPSVEVIVVDDGSTDDSADVIRGYGSRIIPLFKENGGQASALNEGFAQSRGEVVIFLDADDRLLPQAAAEVAEAFCSRPDTAKVQYRMEVIDGAGQRTGVIKPHAHLPLQAGDLRRGELTFPFDLTWLPTSGNAFPARVLRQIMPIPERAYGKIAADWYLVHVAALFGPVYALDKVCAAYRVHQANRYEVGAARLNLPQLRQTITYANLTRGYLEGFAGRLGLPIAPRGILSVSDLANRLISLKLEPEQHPLPSDTVGHLVYLGWRAAAQRFDVSRTMKLLFALWFVLMALSPRRLARPLAEAFLFPGKRQSINRWLGSLHRGTRR